MTLPKCLTEYKTSSIILKYDSPPTFGNLYTVLHHPPIDFTSQKLRESTEKAGISERQISCQLTASRVEKNTRPAWDTIEKVLESSFFIFTLANHATGVPTVITHPGIQSRYIVRNSAGLRDCSKMSGKKDLREQVDEMKKRVREAEEEKRRGSEGVRGREYVMRGSGAGGLAGRVMGSAMHGGLQGQEGMHVRMQGQQDMENDDRRLFFSNGHPNTRPPEFPTDPDKVPARGYRMMLYTPQTGADHERAWTFLLKATVDAPIEETIHAGQTLELARHFIVGRGLPTSDAEKAPLVRQLEIFQMVVGEDPKIYFARVDKPLKTLKSVGIVKEEREIVRIIIRNLSNEYVVEKRSHPLARPNISRCEVEETVRASYANRKYSDMGKLSVAVPAKAPPSLEINDQALAVGGGLRYGGSRSQR